VMGASKLPLAVDLSPSCHALISVPLSVPLTGLWGLSGDRRVSGIRLLDGQWLLRARASVSEQRSSKGRAVTSKPNRWAAPTVRPHTLEAQPEVFEQLTSSNSRQSVVDRQQRPA